MTPKYKRILLKLSGEALAGESGFGVSANKLKHYANEIKSVYDLGVQIAIVIGGGNFFRGIEAKESGLSRTQGDYMGMLATVINGLALQDVLEAVNIPTRVQSAIEMERICEPFIRRRAIRHLEKGRVVILTAGTGNPYFSTDTAASLRALELEVDVLLKATKVDGIYTDDPEKNKSAIKYDNLSYDDIMKYRFKVMDMTAFTLCEENKLPIIVFNIGETGNLKKIVLGETIGTVVK